MKKERRVGGRERRSWLLGEREERCWCEEIREEEGVDG